MLSLKPGFRPLVFVLTLSLSVLLSSCGTKPSSKKEAGSPFSTENTLEVQTIEGNHYIAIAVPLSGPYKELGNSILEGADLAVQEFNAKEAPIGHKIGTVIIDDGGLVSEGLARADLIIAQNALGVIGHLNSEISIESARKYSKHKIVEISPASTNPKLTEMPEVKGFVFRTIGTDAQLGKIAADYVKSKANLKKVAVVYNDRAYGVSVAAEFAKELAKDKTKELVIYQTIPVRTTDHNATTQKLAEAKADLVFFVGEYNDAGYLLKDLRAKLPKIQFLGAEGVFNQAFINIAGANAAENALVIGSSPAELEIEAKYETKYHKPIGGYVSNSYRATKILLEAIKANGYKDPAGIAKKVSQNKTFTANGDLADPDFLMYKVSSGKFVKL